MIYEAAAIPSQWPVVLGKLAELVSAFGSGIISIDKGQSEAGAALGMTPGQSMRRIVLPQAIKRMIPALMNQSIIQFKNTSLVSVLAVPDLVYQSQVAAHDSYRPLETYTAVAVAYAAILIPLTIIVRRGEKRLAVGE